MVVDEGNVEEVTIFVFHHFAQELSEWNMNSEGMNGALVIRSKGAAFVGVDIIIDFFLWPNEVGKVVREALIPRTLPQSSQSWGGIGDAGSAIISQSFTTRKGKLMRVQ